MAEKQKRGGKKEEPTEEELEFIYERFARGLSNSEILEDIQDERTLLRQLPFIVRRRKEFKVAKAVLSKQAEGAYDPDKIENRKKHQQRLSARAQEILYILNKYFPYLDDIKVGEDLVNEDDFKTASLLIDYRSNCLLSHLKNEYPQLSDLKSWDDLMINCIKEWDLTNILGNKADKGIFQGKCDTCKDWD